MQYYCQIVVISVIFGLVRAVWQNRARTCTCVYVSAIFVYGWWAGGFVWHFSSCMSFLGSQDFGLEGPVFHCDWVDCGDGSFSSLRGCRFGLSVGRLVRAMCSLSFLPRTSGPSPLSLLNLHSIIIIISFDLEGTFWRGAKLLA